MTEPALPAKRPRIPISEKTRKFTSVAAAVWTVVGLFAAIFRWSTVEQNSRTFVMSFIFLTLLAGVGAVIFALRGTRRNAMFFLVVASIYPANISRILGWIPLALLTYLFFDSLRIAGRDKLRSARRIWFAGASVVVFMVGSTWYQIHFDSATAMESKRVQRAFQQMTASISKKEGVSTPWLTPVRAGVATFPDGSKASLWVPKPSPKGDRSNCFYVDQTKKNTSYGFIYFECNPPKAAVLLQRQHAVVVGFLSDPKANFVTVTSDHSTARVPVTFGYFIVPGSISAFPLAKFTITYADPGQATCKVSDLGAPGFASSGVCVIA